MLMRNWLAVGVSILDQLKDELHLVLVALNGDFLIDSMDTTEVLRLQENGVEPVQAIGQVDIVSGVRVANTNTGDNDLDFREDRLYGLLKQLVAHGLVIRGADGQWFKGSQHMQLDSVISHNVLDEFYDLVYCLRRVNSEVDCRLSQWGDDIHLDSCIEHGEGCGSSDQCIRYGIPLHYPAYNGTE